MRIESSSYLLALRRCASKLEGRNGAQGTERFIRDAMASVLPDAEIEELLSKYRGVPPDSASQAFIDIVVKRHGIELKVIRMPRLGKNGPKTCLYDLGQIANDYLKLASAEDLDSGELLILVYGPLVEDVGKNSLYREFHNRMFIDYSSSRKYGELRPAEIAKCPDWKRTMRHQQLGAISQMGFDRPCDDPGRCRVVRHDQFALVTIPVPK